MNETALLIAAMLASGTPLAIAGLGLLINEKAGVLNLGAEGMLLMGAAWRRSSMVSNSGTTRRAVRAPGRAPGRPKPARAPRTGEAWAPSPAWGSEDAPVPSVGAPSSSSVPRIRPTSFCSSSTSSRSLTVSVWLMM